MSMMTMATWSAVDAIRQMYQFMRHGDLDRLWPHVRLDENEVPVAGQVQLAGILGERLSASIMAGLSRRFVFTCQFRGYAGCGEIAIAAQNHVIEPFSCPAHILLAVLSDGQSAEFLHRKLQFLPVVR